MNLTQRQADNKIKKLLADKAFEIYEYHQAKPKKEKHRRFYTELYDELYDILWDSMYRNNMEYEYKTLQYDTLLNNRIFIKLIPRFDKTTFLKHLEAGADWNNFGNIQITIRSIKQKLTKIEEQTHDSETVHI